MHTPIAQAVALTIFGNDVLRGEARAEFWPGSTVFGFCKRVRFVALVGDPSNPTEGLLAGDPALWMSRLKETGTVALRLHHLERNDPKISDRMSAGLVGGGGRWLIETLRADQSDLWEARWTVGNQNDPERKIWNVAYFRVDRGRARIAFQTRDLAILQGELKAALAQITAFAYRQRLEGFANAFQTAEAILSSQAPLSEVYHSDLAPGAQPPLAAKQILGAAQRAWVFGGMGSWNDLGFDGQDQRDYEQLSDNLYALLNEAISAAVNASAPGIG